MDPLTAISLASAIVQFIDFSTSLVDGVREVYGSATGATEENRSLTAVVAEMQQLASKMSAPRTGQLTGDERALCRLAAECQIVSDQLLDLLEKVRAKDPRSKTRAALAALRSKLHEREMLELQKRLDGCRSQLELQLSFLSSSETKARLDAMAKSAADDSLKLGTIEAHVEELRQGVAIASFSAEAQDQLRGLLDLSQDVFIKVAQQKVLKVLAFSDMRGRFDAVEEAYAQTFQWIFEGGVRTNTASETFVQWLSSGNGIFHISGKLGSGKSTLMKFLCENSRTKEELQRWAGDRKLVFASFFFWKPGSAMQKSLHGLFRCLLHDTLRESPDLIPRIFPDLWASVTSLPWQSSVDFELQPKQVRSAFSRLVGCRNLYDKHCFCFFIDGLDEYEETHHADYKAMIKILSGWTESAPDDVKLCVSSREYNVFINFFSEHKRLRLQDLTRNDMEYYIRDRLEDVDDDKDKSSIMSTILGKADGIFLWVTLVLKSIRARLDDGYDISKVQDEVDSLPDELEGLFEYLLVSISKTSLQKACQTFALVDAASAYTDEIAHESTITLGLQLDLVSYSFLDDYIKDPNFAILAAFSWSNLDDAALEAREEEARKRLNGHCKGLLQSSDKGVITYTHRTVPEFLVERFKSTMESTLKSFEPHDALSHLLLAPMRTRRHVFPGGSRKLGHLIHGIITIRKRYNLDQEPYEFLECLETVANRFSERKCATRKGTCGFMPVGERAYIMMWGGDVVNNDLVTLTSPLDISAYAGHHEYVQWKMEMNPAMTDSELERGTLVCWITVGALHRQDSKSLELLLRLLRRGLSPETKIPGTSSLVEGMSDQLSIWEGLLLFMLAYWRWTPGRLVKGLGRVLCEYLEFGANPNIRFTIQQHDNHFPMAESPNFDPGKGESLRTGSSKSLLPRTETSKDFEMHIRQADGNVKVVVATMSRENDQPRSIEFLDFVEAHDGEVSLAEFLNFYDLDNKQALLEILERKGYHGHPSTAMDQLEGEEKNVFRWTTDHENPQQQLDLSTQPAVLPAVISTETAVGVDSSSVKGTKRWHEMILGNSLVVFLMGMIVAVVLVQVLDIWST